MIIKLYHITLLFFLFTTSFLTAQGCVAIRHFSSCVGSSLENNVLNKGDIQLGLNYRYFKSYRHFRGTHEEPDRITNNTEVINFSHSTDFFLTYGISDRVYTSITIPTVFNSRSSLYEHGRNERNTTFSRGLGDVRLGVGWWLLPLETNPKGNIAIGLGVKLPTGNYNASDIFYNVGLNNEPQTRPVDQSIQPGDGGFGFTADFQWYQKLTNGLFSYASGFYLLNPREINGIRTFRETLSPLLENESIMAVPDQYSVRTGLSYSLSPTISSSLGARFDCVPVKDLIGGNEGFRRPGNVLSIDPGIGFNKSNFSLNLNVPFAIRRERPQSITDIQTEIQTGNPRHGDAAFADYVINFAVSYRFSSNKVPVPPEFMNEFKTK
ncbi:protein involved in meta-pathway of phenol degradation [Maribacter hydrothermalis]|uniref:Protein involved in meta-pathway of phenol degradation n=1 Tax=Maribacter hydrothermalis TaxID=1836467 RepID=A0A1B7ZBF2_9FLAO|nr:protein involved in meta-pathway of phenol degradation [Maribacter hydrothermalis]APQ16473.1 protein involved in meta-pathway of phenol degradation [Maribacter hydrothermalis]OBR40037.1 protein involved in meta-pathway of phenol degradation [Maribacter hydrothermalis]